MNPYIKIYIGKTSINISVKSMEQRRVMSLGRSSLVISLPKYWTQLNGLKPGDVVSVVMGRDRSLIVFPGLKEEGEMAKISLHVESEDDATSITRNIIACYLNGYSYVRLISRKFFTVTQQRVIRRISKMLYLQIVDADAKEIHLATLEDESKASVEIGIKRIYKVSSSMYRDALTALKNHNATLAKSVYSLDDEVDHFALFMLRLLRKALSSPTLANQLGLDPIDCLDYQIVVNRIEQIADHASNIARCVIMLEGRKKTISEDLIKKMGVAGDMVLSLFDKAFNAFLSNDVRASIEIIKNSEAKVNKLYHEIAYLTFLKESDAEVVCACCSIRDDIKRIADCTVDIAKTAINRSFKSS